MTAADVERLKQRIDVNKPFAEVQTRMLLELIEFWEKNHEHV